jgi:ankyrin repeat protein
MVCFYGHLNVAKWLYEINPRINISEDDEYIFRNACLKGHLDIAKWLLEISPTIDISINNEFAFRGACVNGHLEVVKWLLEISPTINIGACREEAFRRSCEMRHLELVKWFHSLNPKKYNFEQNPDGSIICLINKNINIKITQTMSKEEKEVCNICYDKLEEINTNCGHSFCNDCINHYCNILQKKSCPYCRQNITYFIGVL